MEVNRRDLLKYFGIGTTIVPLANGEARMDQPAKLIAEPNIEPVTAERCLHLDGGSGHLAAVWVQNGHRFSFFGESLIIEKTLRFPGTGDLPKFPELRAIDREIRWTIKGVTVPGEVIPGFIID